MVSSLALRAWLFASCGGGIRSKFLEFSAEFGAAGPRVRLR
ncbi:uncharacterized protein PITG_21094 [Phytophthora infestans T30-4]|uniref:Uncharacterized protein n=1 Tax=Phytophthora infestans (strain T30-4) TaxID=403677 RepID=D0P3A7_PHYIT|nr:uncharacterized protein PITG_21094 [Phytophthora infestans T30-4]EEY59292.1 hypothetical protein PITG_21094 [Phytophthora infestans T30-4]|eukprot:XP_002895213.1 hypothetical protein PITG_21094 [Phytophthora infestans T30-4]